MDALKPNDIAVWASSRLVQHVMAIDDKHREMCVVLFLNSILRGYKDNTGLTDAQVQAELQQYGELQAEWRPLDQRQLKSDYADFVNTLVRLLGQLPEADRNVTRFLMLARIGAIHCNALGIRLPEMMQRLSEINITISDEKQRGEHAIPAGVN